MEKEKKTLGKLKLNQLSKNELEKRDMKVIKGGACGCSDVCKPVTSISDTTVYNEYHY